ncbi:MAG: ATPase, T2SS/T4P/T4SS family [Pseudomonadales bacterium]
MSDDQIESFEEDLDIDLIKTLGKHRFRINLSYNNGNVGAVVRILSYSPMALEDIQLPNIVSKLCLRDKGLILITGTTSQGKTTTLAAMVDYINKKKINTSLPSKTQLNICMRTFIQ